MQITFEKLIEYNNCAATWLEKDKANQNTKLSYAIDRFSKRYNKAMEPYNDIIAESNALINDARTDFASEDADKNLSKLIVKDERGNVTYTEYKYTKENKKLLDQKIRAINKETQKQIQEFLLKTVEIEPYFCISFPDNLTEYEKEIFAGIIIDPKMLEVVPLNGQEKVTASA